MEIVYKLALKEGSDALIRTEYYSSFIVADNLGRIFVAKGVGRSYSVEKMAAVETT